AEKWQEKSASQKAAHCSSQRINSENGKCRKIGIIGEFNSAANSIVAPGREATFVIKLSEQLGRERRLKAVTAVRDFNDKKVFGRTEEFLLKSSSVYEHKLTIPAQKAQGFFGVNLSFQENGLPVASRTYSFCVIQEVETRDPFFGFSCFGPGDPPRCRAMNAGSMGIVMHWMLIEPRKGVLDFSRTDERLDKWTGKGIEPVGMFYSPFDNRQFNTPNWMHKEVMNWRKDNKEPFPDYYYDAWRDFVKAEKYWEKTGDVLDGIHFDPYVAPDTFGPGAMPIGEERGNLRGILHRARDIIATTGKKGIAIAEKGYAIDSSLPVDSPYAKDMAKVAARGFIVAKSVPEVKHYLYFMVYGSWEPDPPVKTDFYMWKKEEPRPVVASYAAAARLLAGAAEPVEVSIHKGYPDIRLPSGQPVDGSVTALSGREFSAVITVEGRKTVVKEYLAPYRVPRFRNKVSVDGSLDEYKDLPPIVLNNTDSIFPSGVDIAGRLWMGPQDLSMKVWLTYDDRCLYFAAEVADDVHVQERSSMAMWLGDGFAIGIDTLNDALSLETSGVNGYDRNDYEFGIALTKYGPHTYMWAAAAGNERLRGDAAVDYFKPAVIQSEPGKWNYELAVPWDCLKPLTCKPGSAFAFNFSYVDIDIPKGGCSYWMALARGITGSKEPALFKTFILE
ncbi:MAG: sugar-binding protein, partial [bacterium]|nr:sugar-binding protein [bacterium]